MNWDEYFINLCIQVSRKSKDRSTRLGAVIVGNHNEILSTGYNGFPRGVDDNNEAYHERPIKYLVTEHAERNAIYNAARHGIRLDGSRMYLPFYPNPCSRCARGVIQSGIKEIIGTQIKFTGKGKDWEEDLALAEKLLDEAGVKMTIVNVGEDLDIRLFNGV